MIHLDKKYFTGPPLQYPIKGVDSKQRVARTFVAKISDFACVKISLAEISVIGSSQMLILDLLAFENDFSNALKCIGEIEK